jgi:hypothetical protein
MVPQAEDLELVVDLCWSVCPMEAESCLGCLERMRFVAHLPLSAIEALRVAYSRYQEQEEVDHALKDQCRVFAEEAAEILGHCEATARHQILNQHSVTSPLVVAAEVQLVLLVVSHGHSNDSWKPYPRVLEVPVEKPEAEVLLH